MDWMTLAIEAVGALIFCVWIVIPIREYRSIYRRLRHRPAGPPGDHGPAGEPPGALVTSYGDGRQEERA